MKKISDLNNKTFNPYTFSVDDSTQFETIYKGDFPVAVLSRRQYLERKPAPMWTLRDTKGNLILSLNFGLPSYGKLMVLLVTNMNLHFKESFRNQ